jgi:hypothetical protein
MPHLDAGAPTGDQQRIDQSPVVDLMIALDQQPASHRRGEERFELPALARRLRVRREPERFLISVQVVEGGLVVGIEGHRQRPRLAVPDRRPAGFFKFCGERRVAARRRKIELQ